MKTTHPINEQRQRAEQIVSRYSAVFTAPPRQTPHDAAVDGPLMGNGDIGVALGGAPERLQFWISKNDFWRRVGKYGTCVKVIGSLALDIPALAGASYRVEQRLWDATTTACFTRDNLTVTMKAWVAATANVLVVELSTSGEIVEVEARSGPAMEPSADSEARINNDVHWFVKKYTRDVTTPTEAACAVRIIGSDALGIRVSPDTSVTLVCAIQSRRQDERYLAQAIALARSLDAQHLEELREGHAAWWKNFWEQSWVEIGDPILEQRYYLSHYLMGCACRDREYAPPIFGTWVTTNTPYWSGDYHLNYNYQAPFYGLYSSNHLEQAFVFHQPILDFMERGKWYAQEVWHCRGVHYPVGIGPKGEETTLEWPQSSYCTPDQYEKGGLFFGQKSNAAYCVTNMAFHWYHTYDEEYAVAVYPFVREVASFWEDYLRFESGRYVIYDDSIHEGSGKDFNPILSLGLVSMVIKLALDMSHTLGIDADRHEKWRHILGHLSAYPIFEREGKTIFRLSERGYGWCDGNTLAIQHIYPAGGIGLDSGPALLAIARDTIDVMQRWRDGNGMNSFYPAAVRVGSDSQVILRQLRAMIQDIGLPNGFIRDNPHGVEHCSTVPNTINEMLIQGHEGVLRFFPGWPADRAARFWNLRLEGAFLVAAEQKEGLTANVSIKSEKGRACTVHNPWPARPVHLIRDGAPAETLSGALFTFATRPGETIELIPA